LDIVATAAVAGQWAVFSRLFRLSALWSLSMGVSQEGAAAAGRRRRRGRQTSALSLTRLPIVQMRC